jgi:asparaginyl-tRNA synthetase
MVDTAPSGSSGKAEKSEVKPIDSNFTSHHTPFFRHPRYLTVSAQLHLEALVHSTPRVWCLSPTFRAERSDTNRHLSEFYMLEAEVAFTSGLKDVTELVESLVRSITLSLSESNLAPQLLGAKRTGESGLVDNETDGELQQRWNGILQKDFWPRISYTDAVSILQNASAANAPQWGDNLSIDHERQLVSIVANDLSPIFVTDYPVELKPFYMLPNAESLNTSKPTVSNFDLLFPVIGEVAGGSLREHMPEPLLHSLKTKGLDSDSEALKWYVDLRRYGGVPHGGFGLGWDRLISYLAGVHSIRDVVTWPRWFGRCEG